VRKHCVAAGLDVVFPPANMPWNVRETGCGARRSRWKKENRKQPQDPGSNDEPVRATGPKTRGLPMPRMKRGVPDFRDALGKFPPGLEGENDERV
jgi:hypothetical protein